MEIENFFPSTFAGSQSKAAWENYEDIICRFSCEKTVLEIGAGRTPIFSPNDIRKHNIDYYANDICESELARVGWLKNKAVFDICGDIPARYHGHFDFVFSKFVLEHVQDGRKYYKNIIELLCKNGISLSFHPTLYCPPFVINKIFPEYLSSFALRLFFPHRIFDDSPKFPAKYEWCYATEKNLKKIQELGFSEVTVVDFYHHRYFSKIPLLKQADYWFSSYCMTKRLKHFASYAFTVTQK